MILFFRNEYEIIVSLFLSPAPNDTLELKVPGRRKMFL